VRLLFERALLPAGVVRDVALEVGADGFISAVTAGVRGDGAPVIRGLALPGMPNLHSHAFQRAMAGLAEVAGRGERSFWGWRAVMYRLVERLAPEDVAAIAAFLYVELLEAGYTSVGEFHYLHHDIGGQPYPDPAAMALAVRRAAGEVGLRQTLLPTLYQQGNFGGAPLEGAQRRFQHDTGRFLDYVQALRARDSQLARTGVAFHSLRAVPPAALAEVTAAVRAADPVCPLHVHIAEQQREVADCVAWSGRRPVEYLLESGVVDAGWCLVHATHVSAAELAAIAAVGAVVGLCPTTEGNLGDGRFALDELLAAGGRFGIGSDSHVSVDPREELRSAEYTLRLWRERRAVALTPGATHTGAALYAAAVAGGGQALGHAHHGLASGGPADVVLIDTDRAEFCGVPDAALVDAYVFAPRPAAIDRVWVGGHEVVAGGRHRARGLVEERYRASIARLAPATAEGS
jgi:formimidoylglutamate deiminase